MCSIPGLPSSGSNVSVLITRVNLNPLCILVEIWGNFDQDRRLAYQQMKKEIQYPRSMFHEAEGSPGDLCLVRVYETWYRARIVSKHAGDYSVFLIDEGRTFRATTSMLAWGQAEFFYLPPEVEFCVLANVLPLSPENKWSAMALEFLKTFCGRTVMACVQDVVVPQRTFILDIPCLSKQMYEMGFVKKLSNERFKDFVTRSLKCSSGCEEPQKTSSMRNEPVELIDQIDKQQCYMYPELQTETVETVVVTEVTNPLRIFCQLKVFSQELKKLTDHITQHFEGRLATQFAKVENLGSPCASRGNDGKWYRSVLQQVMSSNNVAEVLHVDYGKKQFVQVEHVKPLPSEFFRMPVVTYVCSLHGVIDKGVGWTAPQIDYLKSLLLNRTVIAKFEYQSLSEGVHYVTLYGDENTNINNLFGVREKCSIDSKSHSDHTVQKSTSEKSPISFKMGTENTDPASLGDLKAIKSVIFPISLLPSTSHVAVVQHVDSPSKFWIQTQEYADEFDQLMVALGQLYSDPDSSEGLIRKPVVGLPCLAKSQDDVFYRAVVCEIINTKVEVFFLDYGNTEQVDCFSLRELPLEYQKLPAMAVKCALYGIQPSFEHQKATLFFSKAVQDKVLDVHILARSQDTHIVQVIDPLSEGEQDLSKLLCSAGFTDGEGLEKSLSKPAVKPYTKMIQTSDIIKTSAVSQSPGSPTIPRSAFKEYLFPIGSSVEVTVSYVDGPNDFWCQKANNTERLKLLMRDLQLCYANTEFQPPLETACVARHPDNGMWYRALAIEKHQTSHVTVLFIDYGQTKKVALHDLRRINPEFLNLKGQAFRCSLYNQIHPASRFTSDWSPDATTQFREFVDNATSMNIVLKCTVYAVMYNAQKVVFNVVDLETPFQSICSLLTQRGLVDHAPSRKAPLQPFHLDSYYFSTYGIKTGSEEDVSITSVTNVNQFFCHLGRNSVQVEELANKVNNLCCQLENAVCPKTFGKVCFAKYTDGLWYRGQIKSIKGSIIVHFVDYGDALEVEKSDLLPVPFEANEIMSVPVQAIECGLSGMPANVSDEINNWFESFVTDHPLKALVVAKDPDSKLFVELYDGKIQVNAMIKEKFHIEVERNKKIDKKGFRARDMNVQDVPCNGVKSSRGEMRKTDENCEDGVQRFERESDPQWTHGLTKSQNEDGLVETPNKSCQGDMRGNVDQMESNCDVSHKESPNESVNQSGLQQTLNSVKPGQKTEVFISHCNSPLSFFVQLVTNETEIYSLVEKLNNDKAKFVPVNTRDIHEGDLVSAVFPDDGCWYRAVVRKVPVNDVVDVEFIDFGNTAEVSVSKIGILDRSLFLCPRYSIHCSLTGVSYVDSEMCSSFKKEVEENADGLECVFIKLSGSVWEVKLEAQGMLLGSSFFRDKAVTTVHTDAPVTVHKPSTINLCTYKSPDISNGQTIAAYASFISGPHHFWCQYAEPENLQEISDTIQKAGNALETEALSEEFLSLGRGCIALFAEDELWYRAKVTSWEHDTLSVLFVDYGNESKVKMSEVRPLPSEVSDFPPQAFACQIDGFEVSEGFWDDGANDQFFELITDRLLKVTILKLSSSHDVETPHFVKLEIDKLIINEEMKKYWIQVGEKTLHDMGNAPAEASLDITVNTEMESFEHLAASVRSTEFLQTDTECLSSNPFILTPEMQIPEAGCTVAVGQKKDAVLLDECTIGSGAVSSQYDSELITIKELILDEPELETNEIHENNDKKAELKDSDGDVGSDICASQPEDANAALSLDCREEAFTGSQYQQNKMPQSPSRTESSRPLESDLLSCVEMNAVDPSLKKEQPCSAFDDEVHQCVSEREKDIQETIESDLGHLMRSPQRNPVGSACVIWSHAHKNWCHAQILKISEDSTLVLLLDHDSEVLVDPVNVFEIVPEKPGKVPCGVDTERSEENIKISEERTPVLGLAGPPPKAEESESWITFSSPESSDEEMGKELASLTEEQPQDDENCSGDLDVEPERPMHEEMNRDSDSGPSSHDMSEMFYVITSVEQKEPVLMESGVDLTLGADLGVDLRQSFNIALKDQVITEDAEERSPPGEKQRDHSTKTNEQTHELLDVLPVTPLVTVQDVELEVDADQDALTEEVNKDLISLASDSELESDTASEDTLQGEAGDTDPLPVVAEASGLSVKPSIFEHAESSELVSPVTHLTLKVEDPSDDDLIFVKAWQVSLVEGNGAGGEK